MNYRHEAYETTYNGTGIMILKTPEFGWEVYYRKPGFAYEFAFGLPSEETVDNAMELAKGNAENYEDLFTDDDVDGGAQ